jgi:glycosyltransferase involved in cell wall biosynthesis
LRILVLSFYYAPDLSAGSFRTTALVTALQEKNPDGLHIDVVTTLPNRYKTFSAAAPEYEKSDGLEIFRIKLPSHQSGMKDQSKAFIQFFRNANTLVSDREYDLVYATSSRLMTAVLGAWIATRKKALLYLDIRDIFVDTINDVLPKKITLFAKPIFSLLERWAINKANKVNLVSEGFRGYFESRYPNQIFSFFTNGIDDEFIEAGQRNLKKESSDKPIKVLYAGNMGEGQGLHIIIPMLAKKMQDRVQFILIGDGGRKSQLQTSINKVGCNNVELRDPVNRTELIEAYLEADVLFLHLNDYAAFHKVLPSKFFEYAALGKPIWAGVSGYAAKFAKSEIDNAAVFSPCNVNEAIDAFESLELIDKPRTQFISKFSRKNIMKLMVDDVFSIKNIKNL